MKRLGLMSAAAVTALAYLASLGVDRLAPAYPDIPVQIEGQFPLDGHFHGEPLAGVAGVRAWGSHAGLDANTGAVTLGPFVAPARLRFGVTGHPTQPGNKLEIELAATGERRPVPLLADIGARWNIVDFDPPAAGWVGQPIRLRARDGSPTTWLGLTEPVRGGLGEGLNGLRATLAAWIVNGFLLGLLWHAALAWVARLEWVEPPWRPLFAAALVAAVGYVAFWIYFANASIGALFSALALLFALVQVWRSSRAAIDPEAHQVVRLSVAIGAFYLALLHLFPSSREFDGLAANRFRENMPGDNTLPYNLAAALAAGQSPRQLAADYRTSDRPPLQTGWLLLTWPVTRALRLDSRAAGGTAAVWFQLLWVPATFGLLRGLRLPPGRAAAWCGVMALSGFFLQNTVFTWPKLAAGAFACGAFALWILPSAPDASRQIGVGALLASLAWLAHGGVAFSLMALTPWIVWRAQQTGWRPWLIAAGVFLCLALPWLAYQKFYDPPGNMLLKEHLAAGDPADARNTWTAIRDSYHAATWREILEQKRANFISQVQGHWASLLAFSHRGASARRSDEFFHVARALGWWTLAVPLLVVALARIASPGRSVANANWPAHATLLGWTALTIVVWCLLMFHGGHAVIHQGSYAVMLVLFVVLSAWFEFAGRWTLGAVALLQTATLVTTYGVSNDQVHGPAIGMAWVGLTAAALGFVILVAARERSREAVP